MARDIIGTTFLGKVSVETSSAHGAAAARVHVNAQRALVDIRSSSTGEHWGTLTFVDSASLAALATDLHTAARRMQTLQSGL